MSSDPKVRKAVLGVVRSNGGYLSGDTIDDVRCGTELAGFTNKQVRRAVESLHYGHGAVTLQRPRLDEFNRGWLIMPVQ